MTWASVILACLKIASLLLQMGQERKWISEGEEKALASSLAEILRKTKYAKDALEEFRGKSDADLDDFLHKLEPRE